MRSIDADELYVDARLGENEEPYISLRQINDAPTVEPVKHGHWIEVQRIHEKDHTAICECSLCGDTVWVYDGQRAWNYCPNCGAKMDEVEE